MSKKRLLTITSVVALLLVVFVLPMSAQSPLSAEIDQTQISTDDTTTLTVQINTDTGMASAPQLPSLAGFEVVAHNSGRQVSIVNGDMTISAVYRYVLHPTQTGELTIDPISAEIDGQLYQTDPLTVTVTQGAAPAPSAPSQTNPSAAPAELNGQAFFVESEVSNPTPYQGEQISYTFRFYQAEQLSDQPMFEPPSFTGFWSEQEPQQIDYGTEINGRTYRVIELTTAIAPTVVDTLTIEPATLTIPDGFFSRGGTLASEPVTVEVQPLPADAPADFNGAVGQFALQSSVDKTATEVNDTVTLSVVLSGEGNLPTAPDPAWNEGLEWRAFDSEATVDTQLNNGVLRGTKTYERVLVPTRGGDHVLPGLSYTYFNPQTESYETATTDPIVVSVAGDAAPVVPTIDGNSTTAPQNMALRPMKPAPTSWINSAALPQQTSYWLLWLLPLALVAGSFGASRYRKVRAASAESRRSSQAAKKALQALKQARKTNANGTVAGDILQTYLSNKLGRGVKGLTQTELAALLTAHGASSAVASQVEAVLADAEAARFAPSAETSTNDLIDQTAAVIQSLDAELNQHAKVTQ